MRVLLVLILIFAGCTSQMQDSCPDVYEPVCGSDGITYNNSCLAGDINYTAGACSAGCSDSDGLDFTVRGTLASGESDYCIDAKTLNEYYCQDGIMEVQKVCDGACFDGACIAAECSDSDGTDIYQRGVASYAGAEYLDFCNGLSEVVEFSCSSGSIKNTSTKCPAGYFCSDGICTNSPCVDTDGFDIFRPGTTSINNTQYNDYCIDSSRGIEYRCLGDEVDDFVTFGCPNGYYCDSGACNPTCSDLDNGSDIFTGSFIVYGSEIHADICENTLQVLEYTCGARGFASAVQNCPADTTCYNGRCVSKSCRDPDGEDINTRTTVTKGSNEMTDECVDPTNVREYVCVKDKILPIDKSCPADYNCIEGRCAKQVECSEDDSGLDIYQKGVTAATGKSTGTDFCVDSKTINEYYCSGGKISLTTLPCAEGYICSDAACKAWCEETDSGNDPYTPGTNVYGSNSSADYCVDNSVMEYYCQEGVLKSGLTACAPDESCIKGACVSDCVDTDGENFEVRGKVTHGDDRFDDYCLVPHESKEGKEYICVDGTPEEIDFTCSRGYSCFDGKCNPSCEDSDGNDKFRQGTVTFGNESKTDYCTSETEGIEYGCSSGISTETAFECLVNQVCQGGRCVPKTG